MTAHRKTIAHSFKKDGRRYYVPVSSAKNLASNIQGVVQNAADGSKVNDLVAWRSKVIHVTQATEEALASARKTTNEWARMAIELGVRIFSDAPDAKARSGKHDFQKVREGVLQGLLNKTNDPTSRRIVENALLPLVRVWQRNVSEPELGLSPLVQYKKTILEKWRYPKYMLNVASGGHVSALRRHLHNSYFAVVDFKSFYETISDTKIYRSLRSIGLPHSKAFKLTGESTVKNGKKIHLPRGFHQSSILASLVFDRSLLGSLIRSRELKSLVTVYNDDIVLSNSNLDTLKNDFASVLHAAKRSNFQINQKKTQSPRQTVEVFNLLLSHGDIAFVGSRIEKFTSDMRSLKRDCEANGWDYFESLLDLHASYLVSINRIQFYSVLRSILSKHT